MRYLWASIGCGLLLTSLAGGADLPPVSDGYGHGDPPFLLESGWRPLLNGKNLDGWIYRTPERMGWMATSGVVWGGLPNPQILTGVPSPGDRIVNSATKEGQPASDIMTAEKFGDIELYIEFICADRSNSGVYMNGQYEVQIWDSYGRPNDHFTDWAGAIYNYEPGSAAAKEALATATPTASGWKPFGGVAPKVRAERPTGQWQSYHIWFQPPRFDASGKKVANAKFLRVLLNGILVQENVERVDHTQASPTWPESATGPVLLQGDHGPIAFRNIYVRPLRPLPPK